MTLTFPVPAASEIPLAIELAITDVGLSWLHFVTSDGFAARQSSGLPCAKYHGMFCMTKTSACAFAIAVSKPRTYDSIFFADTTTAEFCLVISMPEATTTVGLSVRISLITKRRHARQLGQ